MIKLLLRILKKIRFLDKINIIVSCRYRNKTYKIPIINGLGYENILLNPNWLDSLIAAFCGSENQLFIDVGINLGQTLLRVKSTNETIKYIGFEPNAACCYYVGKVVDLNKFENSTISHTALFDKPGYLVLNKGYDHDLRGSVIENQRPGMFAIKENVFGIKFDEYFSEEKITFVKIDVEGAESEVLQGMQKSLARHRPLVVCEILDSHSQEVFEFTRERANKVCYLMKELNYSLINFIFDKKEEKIIRFIEVEQIAIRQWTPESSLSNDYIFIPLEKYDSSKAILKSLCTNSI